MSLLDFCRCSLIAPMHVCREITMQSSQPWPACHECDAGTYSVVARSTDWARFVQSMDCPHKVQIKRGSLLWALQSMESLDPWFVHNKMVYYAYKVFAVEKCRWPTKINLKLMLTVIFKADTKAYAMIRKELGYEALSKRYMRLNGQLWACGSEPICRNDTKTKWRLQSMYWCLHGGFIPGKHPVTSKSTGNSLYMLPPYTVALRVSRLFIIFFHFCSIASLAS